MVKWIRATFVLLVTILVEISLPCELTVEAFDEFLDETTIPRIGGWLGIRCLESYDANSAIELIDDLGSNLSRISPDPWDSKKDIYTVVPMEMINKSISIFDRETTFVCNCTKGNRTRVPAHSFVLCNDPVEKCPEQRFCFTSQPGNNGTTCGAPSKHQGYRITGGVGEEWVVCANYKGFSSKTEAEVFAHKSRLPHYYYQAGSCPGMDVLELEEPENYWMGGTITTKNVTQKVKLFECNNHRLKRDIICSMYCKNGTELWTQRGNCEKRWDLNVAKVMYGETVKITCRGMIRDPKHSTHDPVFKWYTYVRSLALTNGTREPEEEDTLNLGLTILGSLLIILGVLFFLWAVRHFILFLFWRDQLSNYYENHRLYDEATANRMTADVQLPKEFCISRNLFYWIYLYNLNNEGLSDPDIGFSVSGSSSQDQDSYEKSGEMGNFHDTDENEELEGGGGKEAEEAGARGSSKVTNSTQPEPNEPGVTQPTGASPSPKGS